MISRLLTFILLMLLGCEMCFGQTSFRGLTPGRSTRADVEAALGPPVREVSEALAEYTSEKETEKVFVQYRRGAAIVERIEAVYPDTIGREEVIRALKLPSRPTASRANARGRLEEFFSGGGVVLAYAGADASSGVSRVGYYSRELYESASAGVASTSSKPATPAEERPATSPNDTARPRPDAQEPPGPVGNSGDIKLSGTELRKLTGRYKFTSSGGGSFTEGTVELLDGGGLKLSAGSSVYTLVAGYKSTITTSSDVVERFEQFTFEAMGRPEAVVSFKVSRGKVKEMLLSDKKDGKFFYATAVPNP